MRDFTTPTDRLILGAFVLSILLVGALIAVPVLHAVELSFYKAESFISARQWVGLANYTRVLADPAFWHAFALGLGFALIAMGLQLLLGIGFAQLLNLPLRGRAFVRGAVVLPYLLPTVVIAVTTHWLLDGAYGLFTVWAQQLGFGRPAWYDHPVSAALLIIIASVWTWTPFVTITFLAGLQSIPASLYEAARVDGAGAWKRFWHVTLPMLKPVLLVVVLLRSIWMFNKFDIVWLLTKGGPLGATEHLPILSYRKAFNQFDVGGGAAVATLSFLVLSVMIAIYFWYFPLDEKGAEK
ncbi:carbohydrate ABC transporter permease [Roseateles toxinivorans]|uniref:Multiple sugar transport system permease protein n=1 Tax=Roseateles toxinivorans TaxID=270368 RepID=A0A4R6QT24_9BURK|nr:sugar ABC transporter permease [Roseateles toxinivorans]TDP74501.1 multiple sugar transport system permease protein [Roseateles toxinivorans]